MNAQELKSGSEKRLFALCLLFSLVVWAVLIITVFGLLWSLFVGFFLFAGHALFIAYIKGNGVKLSEAQLPGIYRKVAEASRKLGVAPAPEAYVVQAGGALNAFATKFVGRNFIVLYSDLIEACDEETGEMDMIIGHEIGHLALGHLKLVWLLFPSMLVPWLWPAYSRQREYSCDRCGYEVAGDLDAASRGLAILAAGGKYGKQVDITAFMRQMEDTTGFWASVYELNSSHPYLAKRIAGLMNHRNPGSVREPGRNILAYPLSPFFSMGSPGAGGALLVMVAIVGILAAIAIPQFSAYRQKAKQARQGQAEPAVSKEDAEYEAMDGSLGNIQAAAVEFQARTGNWPCGMEDLQLQALSSLAAANNWEIVVNCEQRLAAVIYAGNDGKKYYRSLLFETGERGSGPMDE